MTSALARPPAVVDRSATLRPVLRPAPRREPPFDDELDETGCLGRDDQRLPFPGNVRMADARAAVRSTPSPLRTAVPDPARWGWRLLIGIIETSAGKRPLHQLASLMSAGVARGLGEDFEQVAALGRPHWTHSARVRSVRSASPAADVAELSATLQAGSRVHAVAMRLEVRHGRWCCTRLVLG